MGTLGVWLRQTREAKGSTLEQVEDATRIRPRFLEALEAGDFTVFPGGEVQVRGFLRIYARYLDLSPDQVLARYDLEIHGAEAASQGAVDEAQPASQTRPVTRPAPPPPLRSAPISASGPRAANLTTLAIVSVAIIILTAALVTGGYYIIRNAGEETTTAATVTPTAPSEVEGWPTATAPTTPDVTPTFLINPEGGVTLSLEATEHVWVRVIADGAMVFSGMLAPDQPVSWLGQEMITVETGNGAGLQVTVNEQLQGTMCGRGEVCARTWGPTGEIFAP
jgi:cytoskeleton protein RodZ